jgi:hypothetical protein
MKTSPKQTYEPKLRGRKLELYGQIMARERQGLYMSPERRDWVLKNYPSDREWGRAVKS